MTLLTLFSAPKPFTNPHIAMIQRNAIKSWTLLPDVEVILLGEETGLAEAAREFGVKHIPNVARNESGVPLISSMFQLARENSNSDLLCIINADMILMPDFVEAAKRVKSSKVKFVLLSQRWDYDIPQPLDFSPTGGSRRLGNLSENRISFTVPQEAISSSFLFPLSLTSPLSLSAARAGTIG
jgi:hypothetical protein